MSAFWRGVGVTVVGGILVYACVFLTERSLFPEENVRWGAFDTFNVPDELVLDRYGLEHFTILVENRGWGTAKNIEVFFKSKPKLVVADPKLPVKLVSENGTVKLLIDQLGPGDTVELNIFGLHRFNADFVRQDGKQIESSYVSDRDFGRMFGVELPFLVFWIGLLLAFQGLLSLITPIFEPGKEKKVTDQKADKVVER